MRLCLGLSSVGRRALWPLLVSHGPPLGGLQLRFLKEPHWVLWEGVAARPHSPWSMECCGSWLSWLLTTPA